MSDVIDRLVDRLNEIDGLKFVRDALVSKNPANYGVVRLTGQSAAQWADDMMVEQAYRASVAIYVNDDSNRWLREVQAALSDVDIGYTLPERGYDYEHDAVMWRWECTLYGPLESEDVDGEDGR